MRRREILAGLGAAAVASTSGCIVMPRGVEVEDGAEHVVSAEAVSSGTSDADLKLQIDQGTRSRADYVVAVHEGEQWDMFELGSGETHVELTVPDGAVTLLFIRGGEVFERGYSERHRGGTTVARSVVRVYKAGVV